MASDIIDPGDLLQGQMDSQFGKSHTLNDGTSSPLTTPDIMGKPPAESHQQIAEVTSDRNLINTARKLASRMYGGNGCPNNAPLKWVQSPNTNPHETKYTAVCSNDAPPGALTSDELAGQIAGTAPGSNQQRNLSKSEDPTKVAAEYADIVSRLARAYENPRDNDAASYLQENIFGQQWTDSDIPMLTKIYKDVAKLNAEHVSKGLTQVSMSVTTDTDPKIGEYLRTIRVVDNNNVQSVVSSKDIQNGILTVTLDAHAKRQKVEEVNIWRDQPNSPPKVEEVETTFYDASGNPSYREYMYPVMPNDGMHFKPLPGENPPRLPVN